MTLLVGNNINDGTNDGGNPDQQEIWKFVAVESGTVSSAVISLENEAGNFRLVAWGDDGSGNNPGAHLGTTDEVAGGSYTAQTEISANFPSGFEVIEGDIYWIGIHRDGYHQVSTNSAETTGFVRMGDVYSDGSNTTFSKDGGGSGAVPHLYLDGVVDGPSEIRKSSTFDVETELSGTITDATLDGNAITVDSQDGTTVTLTDSDGSITTSGEYDLVLTDDSDPAEDETITVQVDVYGVVPSDNPWQKDGSALADLTDVQYRVVAGTDLDGTELFYTGTGETDESGNIPTFDVSDSAAEVDDTVQIVALSDAGESIVATETVELI